MYQIALDFRLKRPESCDRGQSSDCHRSCNFCLFSGGQATEPECLAAVGLAAGDDRQVDNA